jgi:hypothetical protein
MIQAPQPKPIETKAPVGAEVSSKANKAKVDLEGSLEAQDFANELEASLSGEAKVKPVEVTVDQVLELPSTLVNQQSGNVDSTSPKVFDPALTKSVEKLIQPTTTEVAPSAAPAQLTDAQVLELANAEASTEMKGEIAQAMLKTPQVAQNKGRAPAIEFAQTEIDPQLLNMEDFVAQKNLATKKEVSNAYGMKALPQQQQKLALESGLKQTQVVNEASAVDSSPVNSQQFILNMMNEQQSAPQINETQAAPKVFDMSNIKTTNGNEVINQITDYVVQARAAKEPTVNMRVNHEELGMIDITVSKSGVNHESIAVNIGAHSMEGKSFFQQNSKELFSHLSTAGLSVSDLKVETPNQTAKNDFDFGSQSGRNQHASDKNFGSEQNQRRHEQERRQDLWKLLNQEAA